jgi:polar amino acid transport system substrate-binding protein
VRERVILIGLLLAVLLLVGCGGPSAPKDKCELDNPPLFEEGVLTVATDKPAYPPWFKGSSKDYSGYEGDIASEIANRMDLPIKWTVEPFNKSYALAPKTSTSTSTRSP